MADGGNGDWLPKPVRLVVWFYIGAVLLSALGLVLFNPGNVFGESEAIIVGWFQKYPGQSNALQILGTFIVTMGVMPYLFERRLNGSVPRAVRSTALAGAWVVMAGLAIQDIPESYLAPAVLGALSVSVVPVLILSAAWAWLKSRRKSGG